MWRSHPGRLNGEENSHLGRIINEAAARRCSTNACARRARTTRSSSSSATGSARGGRGVRRWHRPVPRPARRRRPRGRPAGDRRSTTGTATPRRGTTSMAEIRGPAVAHVLDTFTRAVGRPDPARPPQPLPRRRAPPRADAAPPRAAARALRTRRRRPAGTRCRSCAPTPRSGPATRSRPTASAVIARAYARRFSRAHRLVYVEDQYLWSDVVATTLADALRREPGAAGDRGRAAATRTEDGRVGGPPIAASASASRAEPL